VGKHLNLYGLVCVLVLAAGLCGRAESIFPLARGMAGDMELPKPYGIGTTVYYQAQDYRLTSLRASIPGLDVSALMGAAQVMVENDLYETDVEVDVWIFPFLNACLLLGYIDGETSVAVDLLPDDLNIKYDGVVYGAGLTAAAGWKALFATMTATYTTTELDVANSSVEAWVLAPKTGMNTCLGAFWVGAMYQEAEEKHEGTINVNLGPGLGQLPVSYNIGLEQDDPWNYLAGFQATIFDSWNLMIEGGVGNRNHAAVTVTYRF